LAGAGHDRVDNLALRSSALCFVRAEARQRLQ
jgi:hypothetical protein